MAHSGPPLALAASKPGGGASQALPYAGEDYGSFGASSGPRRAETGKWSKPSLRPRWRHTIPPNQVNSHYIKSIKLVTWSLILSHKTNFQTNDKKHEINERVTAFSREKKRSSTQRGERNSSTTEWRWRRTLGEDSTFQNGKGANHNPKREVEKPSLSVPWAMPKATFVISGSSQGLASGELGSFWASHQPSTVVSPARCDFGSFLQLLRLCCPSRFRPSGLRFVRYMVASQRR